MKKVIGIFLWNDHCLILLFSDLPGYYTLSQEQEYICTQPDLNGMHQCSHLPPFKIANTICNETAKPRSINNNKTHCINWNQYYTNCLSKGDNPFQGTISFDNIGLAWVAIFLVSNKIFDRDFAHNLVSI